MAAEKFNVYQMVTDRIIAQLEKGEIPWHKPWGGVAGGAFNRVSKRPYSLINQLLLEHNGEYATFKQWKELGGTVRKGEKSEVVVFWKMLKVEDKNDKGEKTSKTIPILRYYHVFHISQVDGVKSLEVGRMTQAEPIEAAEKIKVDYMEREGIKIREIITDKAFYAPTQDFIQVPCKRQYKDINDFYATLFHEMTHSTGHESRLNRFAKNAAVAAFGSEDYSKEELVAELGSAMLMNHCGIETGKTLKNSAAYIQSWLRALKNDNRMIVSAAGKAEKSAKYVLYGKDMEPAKA